MGKGNARIGSGYAARRSVDDPPTFREYLQKQDPGQPDEFAFIIARMLMNHSDICQLFDKMHALVLDMPEDAFSLLTSDRSIWMTPTLTEDDAFITMPIGPKKLFTAVVKSATQRTLKARRRSDLVKVVNKLTVQHAIKYVYGLTDGMLPFIQKHMATKRDSTLLERLAASRGHQIVAPDSPFAKG